MKLQIIIIAFLVFACGSQEQQNKKLLTQHLKEDIIDSIRIPKDTIEKSVIIDSIQEAPAIDLKKEMIIGAWTDGSYENASFGIDDDSIFYVEALETYHYKIIADSIIIDYNDWVDRYRVVKLTQDSMVWISNKEDYTFWRFKD